MMPLDLNADLGESWYDHHVGDDANLMPLLDSCNIACGFHGGDAYTLQKTVELAIKHQVAVGAHPSFPDRKNFGRKRMDLPLEKLQALLFYQIGALQAIAHAGGTNLHHIKPHGALYHYLNDTPVAAEALVTVAKALKIPRIYGPPQGALRAAAAGTKLEFWGEGFADRTYEPSLKLRQRSLPSSTISKPALAAEQVRLLATEQAVIAGDGSRHSLQVKTVCIHGDHPGALARAKAVRAVLDQLS